MQDLVIMTSKRKPDKDALLSTRDDILLAASREFEEHGLAGARIDRIADRTNFTKGMIYYHFASKEELYIAVIEKAYLSIRVAEDRPGEALSPIDALKQLVELTFDFHMGNPQIARLISIENINGAKYISQSKLVRKQNRIAIERIDRIIRDGVRQNLFARGIDAREIHYLISALCVFRVSNRNTFAALFDYDFMDDAVVQRHRMFAVESVLCAVLARQRGPNKSSAKSYARDGT